MSRRVVVTGGGGFVGQWLTRELLRRDDEIWLAGIQIGSAPSILTDRERDAVRWVTTDIRNQEDVHNLFIAAKPDVVMHLAGVSSIPEAERDLALSYDVNVTGSVRVVAAAAGQRVRGQSDPVVLVVGSGTQYGVHPADENPLPETAEQRPGSVYAATKAAQETAALQIGRSSGLRVICTRSFNHAGPGQAAEFLFPSLVTRVRAARASGGQIRIGNDVVRDYLHVEDVVAAYLALVSRGQPGETYNVCSGAGLSVRKIAEDTVSRAGVKAEVISDRVLERASDPAVLIGSPAKLQRDTSWRPKKTHLDIIDELLSTA